MPTVQRVYRGKTVETFYVTDKHHGNASVRVGIHGVFACLGCHKIDCFHAKTAEEYADAQDGVAPKHSPQPAA